MDTEHTDSDESEYGPRDYPPEHREIELYHRKTSEDGVTIYDPNGMGRNEETYMCALPGFAVSLPDAV